MSLRVQRDGGDVVIRIKAGGEAGETARFLEGAATAIEHGHIPSTNPRLKVPVTAAADVVRKMAGNIHKVNA